MARVGIRELKSRLSRYLSRVKQGEPVVVTERGTPIAVIIPSGLGGPEEAMTRLASQGIVLWAGGKPKLPSQLLPLPGKPLSQVVLEGRR